MTAISLLGVASYLPARVVANDFFAGRTPARRGMFTAPETRRHVPRDLPAAEMIANAASVLLGRVGQKPEAIDIIFTNVTIPDEPFTGCGADVARRLGANPRWVIDLHNTGCVSFIYMLELARLFLQHTGARGALLCTVQNAAGRLFSQPGVRETAQAPVPGDGCGVGYVVPGDESPVLSVLHRLHRDCANDMTVTAEDGRKYWEPGLSPINVAFTEERVASIIARGNRLVPDIVQEACRLADIRTQDINLLITNQPNPVFLRNWREALELPPESHHDTFNKYGNLFGAAIPVNLDDAIESGRVKPGALVALGGFSHAGDYSAAAIIRSNVRSSLTTA